VGCFSFPPQDMRKKKSAEEGRYINAQIKEVIKRKK
jgi:hypothetical protein